ncbi:DnaJ-domain-containing protein [Auricularia subglabra TFB-10046 SS5]|nr:DnaJ-domain-containing protein [Auricularia subglabra TFB-10046 SS5]
MPPANAAPGRSYTTLQEDAVQRVLVCELDEHYAVLDLKEDAEPEEIKRAFKTLALLVHPDKNAAPGAEDAFKLVQQAYETLGDVHERAAYDNERRGGFSSFFSSYTTEDYAPRASKQPPRAQPQHKSKPRRNETRKQRRQREYEERLARQRARQDDLREARRMAEAEELLRRFAREAGKHGLKFWYCRECDDVHLEGDVHVQGAHGSARTRRASRSSDSKDGIFETLFTLVVLAAGLLLVLFALYYAAKLLFTSTIGKIFLGVGAIMTVLYFVPEPTPATSSR